MNHGCVLFLLLSVLSFVAIPDCKIQNDGTVPLAGHSHMKLIKFFACFNEESNDGVYRLAPSGAIESCLCLRKLPFITNIAWARKVTKGLKTALISRKYENLEELLGYNVGFSIHGDFAGKVRCDLDLEFDDFKKEGVCTGEDIKKISSMVEQNLVSKKGLYQQILDSESEFNASKKIEYKILGKVWSKIIEKDNAMNGQLIKKIHQGIKEELEMAGDQVDKVDIIYRHYTKHLNLRVSMYSLSKQKKMRDAVKGVLYYVKLLDDPFGAIEKMLDDFRKAPHGNHGEVAKRIFQNHINGEIKKNCENIRKNMKMICEMRANKLILKKNLGLFDFKAFGMTSEENIASLKINCEMIRNSAKEYSRECGKDESKCLKFKKYFELEISNLSEQIGEEAARKKVTDELRQLEMSQSFVTKGASKHMSSLGVSAGGDQILSQNGPIRKRRKFKEIISELKHLVAGKIKKISDGHDDNEIVEIFEKAFSSMDDPVASNRQMKNLMESDGEFVQVKSVGQNVDQKPVKQRPDTTANWQSDLFPTENNSGNYVIQNKYQEPNNKKIINRDDLDSIGKDWNKREDRLLTEINSLKRMIVENQKSNSSANKKENDNSTVEIMAQLKALQDELKALKEERKKKEKEEEQQIRQKIEKSKRFPTVKMPEMPEYSRDVETSGGSVRTIIPGPGNQYVPSSSNFSSNSEKSNNDVDRTNRKKTRSSSISGKKKFAKLPIISLDYEKISDKTISVSEFENGKFIEAAIIYVRRNDGVIEVWGVDSKQKNKKGKDKYQLLSSLRPKDKNESRQKLKKKQIEIEEKQRYFYNNMINDLKLPK